MLNCYYAHADTEEGAQVTPPVISKTNWQAAPDKFLYRSFYCGTCCRSNVVRLQQATRLQRRCYWLLESEDDIVLVHYLNIDKAKGKTEDLWTSADPEMARRPGFTVTSGGVHGMQVLLCGCCTFCLPALPNHCIAPHNDRLSDS